MENKINLLGISGKAKSRKDTIGKIIKYLDDQNRVGNNGVLTFEEFLKSPYHLGNKEICSSS